jgi:hypothetical protein
MFQPQTAEPLSSNGTGRSAFWHKNTGQGLLAKNIGLPDLSDIPVNKISCQINIRATPVGRTAAPPD